VHDDIPVVAEYLPLPQTPQEELPAILDVPTTHISQLPPAEEKYPEGQLTQVFD
jgi:hypothetical protein